MKQKPSEQFYIQDFLASTDVQAMDATEVGCYCLLLFNCMNNGGSLPADKEYLKRLCRGVEPSKLVLNKFYTIEENGMLCVRNARVDFEIKKKKRFSQEMKALANKRWQKAETDVCDTHTDTQCDTVCLSISNKNKKKKNNKKEKKIANGETDRGKSRDFDILLDKCKEQNIYPALTEEGYEAVYKKYSQWVNVSKESLGCVDWLFGKRDETQDQKQYGSLTTNRLINRMKFAIKFEKDQEIKRLQSFQDRKFFKPAKKKTDVWKPPVIEGEIDELAQENSY